MFDGEKGVTAYYNEHDPKAAAWIRELIRQGHIAPGEVDERSIEDVVPAELVRFTQCHFFAGIGVWSYALRCAGWPDDRPVWTGSCPCQPFSSAGKGGGTSDERHLWPAFFHLIHERRPVEVFGEQVESAIRHGWLDLVQSDMEGIGYAFGTVGLPACGFGAPHLRQRTFFVAHDDRERCHGEPVRLLVGEARPSCAGTAGGGKVGVVGNPDDEGSQGRGVRPGDSAGELPARETGAANGFWSDAEWLPCRDGKWRAVEPGTFPLAHGTPARVGRLRGYGNAIVAPVAEAFVRAYMETRG